MEAPSPTKIAAIVLIVLALAVPFAVQWGFSKFEKEEVSGRVLAMVKETTVRCGDALALEPAVGSKAQDIDARLRHHLATIDRYATDIRNERLVPDRSVFVQAGTDYVLTCREILLRQIASFGTYGPLTTSMQALRDHMRGNSRASGWREGAMSAKTQLDNAYREYRIAADAYSNLLDSFSASHPKIAAHIERGMLIDESFLKEARDKAMQASAQTANEVKKLTRLESYR